MPKPKNARHRGPVTINMGFTLAKIGKMIPFLRISIVPFCSYNFLKRLENFKAGLSGRPKNQWVKSRNSTEFVASSIFNPKDNQKFRLENLKFPQSKIGFPPPGPRIPPPTPTLAVLPCLL